MRDFHINNWHTPGSYPSWNAPGSLLRRRRPDPPTPRSGISDSQAGPHQSRDLSPPFRLPEDNPRLRGGTDPPRPSPGDPGTDFRPAVSDSTPASSPQGKNPGKPQLSRSHRDPVPSGFRSGFSYHGRKECWHRSHSRSQRSPGM